MAKTLKIASAQCRTLDTTADTLNQLEAKVKEAASAGVDLVLFPEAYFGGYPRCAIFGVTSGGHDPQGYEQYLKYYQGAVDLGDTPPGADEDWVHRRLPVGSRGYRGDGIREELERIARESGVFVVTGVIERSGGTLYCSVVCVHPTEGTVAKRREVMPTARERLVWGQGHPRTLRAVDTTINGVRLTIGIAICWENYMPLLCQALYQQNVNLFLAPTADGGKTWLPLMQTIGFEGRAFLVSSNQAVQDSQLPQWIHSSQEGKFVTRGGSCIVSPFSEVLAGPSWEKDGDILAADMDFEDCVRGPLDFDAAGSYSRNDGLSLTVTGLDLSPPP